MITRLLLAKLIPMAIGYVTKTFRKNRAEAKQPKQAHPSNTEALNNDEHYALEDNG
jgi:hypothetical protein